MSLWRQLKHGFRALVRRRDSDRDIADEVQHYFEKEVADLVAHGTKPAEAQRAVRVMFGNEVSVREEIRSYGWENVVENVFADVRHGVRRLRANLVFTSASTVTLALGIGASTAIFSVVKPILLDSLPYPDAHRLVMLWDRTNDGSQLDVTFGTFRELEQRSRSFDALAVMRTWQPTLTGAAEPERLDGQRVTAGFFSVLGLKPELGRDFQEADDAVNAPPVAIISNALWQRWFNSDRAALGKSILLDGAPHTVIGVLPARYESVLSPTAEVWRPLQYERAVASFDGREWGHHLRMVGRLRAGVDADEADRELKGIARAPLPELPRPRWAAMPNGMVVNPLQTEIAGPVKPTLVAVMGAVFLLLLIACVNVTNLLLARGAERQGEFAMRAALGAGRGRLLQQFFAEGMLLALIGGVLGVGVATLGVRALIALSPPGLPRLNAIRIDSATFAYAFVATTLVGLLVGAVPALYALRANLGSTLQRTSRRSVGGRQRVRGALVVAEVALAFMLLAATGLLLRSLDRLFSIDTGFDTARVLTMQVQTSGPRFNDEAVRQEFFAQALAAVKQVPGVTDAAFTSQLPLSGDRDIYGINLEGTTADAQAAAQAYRYAITPAYFETLSIPLRQGRLLSESDAAGTPNAVINESFARQVFPGKNPIGQRIHVGDIRRPAFTIVGVVGDVKQMSLGEQGANAAYIPTQQWFFADNALWLIVRTRGNPAALASAIKSAVWSVDREQPILHIAALDNVVQASTGPRRFALTVFEAFALIALLLAATGIYGLLSGSVNERMREIGVRAALGASRREILSLVLKQGLVLAALGSGLGLVGALTASRALVTLLFDVSPLDVITHAGVILLLVVVAGIACALPAWRAVRVDPMLALRAE
jgi:putative ABC transport system permease protein